MMAAKSATEMWETISKSTINSIKFSVLERHRWVGALFWLWVPVRGLCLRGRTKNSRIAKKAESSI